MTANPNLRQQPPDSLATLSASERDVLRLLATGHDVKSAARALDLSSHAINERLRTARRKLGTTSSREAARLLAQSESADQIPNFSGDKTIGMAGAPADAAGKAGLRSGAVGARRRFLVPAGVFVMTILIAALAFWANASSNSAGTGTTLSATAPHVLATTPAAGATIPPGPFILSVTFDRPMQPNNYSFVRVSPETFPDCSGQPSQSTDGRTFRMDCRAAAGRHYEVWFNQAPYTAFMAPDGTRAAPHRLIFATSAP